ncbi:MAG: hypothetical protein HQ543_02175 [Bacteroidetes bacterium]|nr:hypothetical protein [Bacteroidota bacterium]
MKIISLIIISAGFWISSFCQEPAKIEIISADLFFSEIIDSTYGTKKISTGKYHKAILNEKSNLRIFNTVYKQYHLTRQNVTTLL